MPEPRPDAPPSRRPGPLETSILFDIFALNQAVGRLLSEAMRDGPLTPGEYAVYSAIFELEAASPTQIAARLGVRLTTFMDQLRLVERRGHTRRIANPSDRRSYRVVLTASGREAHRAANRRFEEANRAFIEALGDAGGVTRDLLGALRSIVDGARTELAAGAAAERSRA